MKNRPNNVFKLIKNNPKSESNPKNKQLTVSNKKRVSLNGLDEKGPTNDIEGDYDLLFKSKCVAILRSPKRLENFITKLFISYYRIRSI